MTEHHAKETSLWLIACASWVVLPYAFHLPIWALIPFIVMAIWRYMIHAHGWRSPNRAIRMILSALAMLIIYQQYQTFFGRDAGLTFLLLLMGLKFSELNNERDRVLLVYILFLLILGNFLFSQSIWVAGYLLVAVIACLATLVQIQQPDGMTIRKRVLVSGKLMLLAIPLMLIMYFLFPRLSMGLWGVSNPTSAGTGFSEEMRPGSFSRLIESRQPVFRVEFKDNQVPPAPQQYWRGAVLSESTGRRWFNDKTIKVDNEEVTKGSQLVTYTMTLEPNEQGWLFPLDLPVNNPGINTYKEGLSLRTKRTKQERRRYRLQSYLQYETSIPENQNRYLALPSRTSERIKNLATKWRNESLRTGNDFQSVIVTKAMQYFRNELFYYTLEPPLLGGDPVDEFLFETRKGYCEHYASAFVTLMRAAGVPARAVVGFQGGEFNNAGNYLTVRQSDAHAWAEYLHPDKGWVRVDPTAAVAPSRIEYGIDSLRELSERGLDLGLLPNLALKNSLAPDWLKGIARGARQRWDAVNFAWYRWVEDFGPYRQKKFLEALGLLNTSWMSRIAIMAAIVIFLLAIIAAYILRKPEPQDKTLKLYLKFCKKLSKLGFERLPAEGPEAFARRVCEAKPEWSDKISKIADSYVSLRYGKTGIDVTLKKLRVAIQEFKPA